MYTKEGKQLLKEVKNLFKNTPFLVEDKSDDYDRIFITLLVEDNSSVLDLFKSNLQLNKLYKKLIELTARHKFIFRDKDVDNNILDVDILSEGLVVFVLEESEENMLQVENDDLSESFNGFVKI